MGYPDPTVAMLRAVEPERETPAPPRAVMRQCEGTKSTGVRCGAPALRGKFLCYYHHPARRNRPRETRNSKLLSPTSAIQ